MLYSILPFCQGCRGDASTALAQHWHTARRRQGKVWNREGVHSLCFQLGYQKPLQAGSGMNDVVPNFFSGYPGTTSIASIHPSFPHPQKKSGTGLLLCWPSGYLHSQAGRVRQSLRQNPSGVEVSAEHRKGWRKESLLLES